MGASMSHHQSLVDLAKQSLSRFSPIPAGVSPDLNRLHGVKCVVFDVYGTLLLSDRSPAAGDRNAALREILESLEITCEHEKPASAFHSLLQKKAFSARLSGASSPEFDVRKLWKRVLGESVSDQNIEKVALAYECAMHRVWLAPNVKSVLSQLSALGLPLGILSNAQFYTPILLEALLGMPLSEFGFMDTLSFYSYECGESKPGPLMFDQLVGRLERLHLRPNETLIVGNDLNNDIAPAQERDFKTLLVAQDERSLTMDSDGGSLGDPIEPNATITSFDDLFQII